MSAILDLVEAGNDIERLRKLLKEGEDPNFQNGLGETPLHIIVRKSERNPQNTDELLISVQELINFNAYVDLQDLMGYTPLLLATICRNCKMIDLLLKANADINQKDSGEWSPLHYATTNSPFHRTDDAATTIIYETKLSVVKLLLRHNPEIDIRNRMGETALMFAVRDNKLPIVQELLAKNASTNLQNSHGNNAMFYALDRSELNANILLELMKHGCSLNKPNKMGRTPKDYFCRRLIVNRPRVAIEKAMYVLKLFIFDYKSFDSYQDECIAELCMHENRKFTPFLYFCQNECLKMHRDELAPNYSVYTIAFRGAFCTTDETNQNLIPLEVSDKVVDKLLTRQYPVYCDIIASGLCTSYMRSKFVEKCCGVKLFNQTLHPIIIAWLSKYLSNFDMLNIIYAYCMV